MSYPKWIEDHNEVMLLARWLNNEGTFDDCRDMLAFFEKPWNGDNERVEMIGLQNDTMFKCVDCDNVEPRTSADQTRCEGCHETRLGDEADRRSELERGK